MHMVVVCTCHEEEDYAKGIPRGANLFIHEREEKGGAMHSTCLWLHISGKKGCKHSEVSAVQSQQHPVYAEAACYFSKKKVE